MKTTKLLSAALVVVMALSLLSVAGVATTTKTKAYIEDDDYAAALESGSLEWTASVTPQYSGSRFFSVIQAQETTDVDFTDGDYVRMDVVDSSDTTQPWAPGDNTATLSTQVDGPGTITWVWRLMLPSDENAGGQIVFLVDGKSVKTVDTDTSLVSAGHTIKEAGSHTLSWQLSMGLSTECSDGAHVYLDAVTWTPPTQTSVITDVQDIMTTTGATAADFATTNNYNAYLNKLAALEALIAAGNYDEAQLKITNDLMKHTSKWVTEDPTGQKALNDELQYIYNELGVL